MKRETEQPTRLLDDPGLSADARALLDAGRALTPVTYDVTAGAAKFRAALEAAAAAGGAGAGGAASAAGLASTAKLTWLVLVLGGGALLGSLAVWRPWELAESAPLRRAADAAPATEIATPVSAAEPDVRASQPRQPQPQPQPQPQRPQPPQPEPAAAVQTGQPTAARAGRPQPAQTIAEPAAPPRDATLASRRMASSAVTDTSRGDAAAAQRTAAAASAHGPERAGAAKREPVAVTPSSAVAPSTVAPVEPDTHESGNVNVNADREAPPVRVDELQSIAMARRLLGPDPGAALKLLQQVARDHPRGFFVEERKALTVLALAALGRDEAEQKGAAFLREYPHSPHAARVKAALK